MLTLVTRCNHSTVPSWHTPVYHAFGILWEVLTYTAYWSFSMWLLYGCLNLKGLRCAGLSDIMLWLHMGICMNLHDSFYLDVMKTFFMSNAFDLLFCLCWFLEHLCFATISVEVYSKLIYIIPVRNIQWPCTIIMNLIRELMFSIFFCQGMDIL